MPGRGFHGDEADHLEQVVLDHVADRSRLVVEGAAARDVERLGHRDLDARNVIAIPERLHERVGEAEVEQVLDRLLAEVMVDPEDRRLGEHAVDGRVQGNCARQITPEWLLENDPGALRTARCLEVGDDLTKQGRRNREVVQRVPASPSSARRARNVSMSSSEPFT